VLLENKFRLFDARKAEPVLTSGAWRSSGLKRVRHSQPSLRYFPCTHFHSFPTSTGGRMRQSAHGMHRSGKSASWPLSHSRCRKWLAVVLLGILLILIYGRIRKKHRGAPTGNLDITLKVRADASFIAQQLGVRFVTFGHTHYADVFRCSDNPVFQHWNLG